jgi:hypothetical protein
MVVFGPGAGETAGPGEAAGDADGSGDADGDGDGDGEAAGAGAGEAADDGAGDGVGSGSAHARPADAAQPAIIRLTTANRAAIGAPALSLIEQQGTAASS